MVSLSVPCGAGLISMKYVCAIKIARFIFLLLILPAFTGCYTGICFEIAVYWTLFPPTPWNQLWYNRTSIPRLYEECEKPKNCICCFWWDCWCQQEMFRWLEGKEKHSFKMFGKVHRFWFVCKTWALSCSNKKLPLVIMWWPRKKPTVVWRYKEKGICTPAVIVCSST